MYRLTETDGKLCYADEILGVNARVFGGWAAELVQTPQIAAMGSEEEIRYRIQHPSASQSLGALVQTRNARTVSILVSDATRAVPTAKLLKWVVEELVEADILLSDIHVFVAVGVHRAATEKEMEDFLGEFYGKISIENHRPFSKESLWYLGETSRGTPVWVNRRAMECDLHLQIGKVEPHEFAGFSGGRKSVLPGICGEKTITQNHRPEMILHGGAGIGLLEGNPVHEDMVEAAGKYRIDFGVNCVLNNELELAAVFAGGMEESHRQAVDYVREQMGVGIERPDILVTTPGNPLDIDFYQAVKALIALTEILDERTVVVLYCGCPEGVNSPDMLRAFYSGESLEQVVSYTVEHYKIQMDHVLLLSKILRKGVKVVVCCPNLSEEEIRGMFMIPAPTLQAAMDRACQLSRKAGGKVLFYPRPQTGLAVLRER